ncbi:MULTISPECIES: carbohydrate ABC transporter permease [unclassified Frondihabitans]|uniref:carbohydrate ABC transporter permease n=1 Tax=unclassified Frondihabitans TaxID=2626248 RepID=UPI000F4F81CC|nr:MULTISPECIES: sugar ABC transporter permease [unclassified Frondihabitans]RPE78478.1 carbohydrate ABC transporter membrane protein 1 (CUT1 family) [Frondihabitans sp. PhB153]RPF08759.1 carbohydrate ABC transporter membrane protein 1 (CUT1 family) [Frondihabitans sp. PhB161]
MTTETLRPPKAAAPGRPKLLKRDGAWPWLFVSPLLLGIAVFFLWPIIQTAYFSLTTWGVFGGSTFTGVANYIRLFADPQLYLALGNTLLYTAIVLLGVPLAVWFASLLNTPGLRFASFYRVLFFLPYVAMPTAIAMVWRIIFNGDFGILNYLLKGIGVQGPYWISTPGFAMVAVAIVGLWSSLGFSMIILGAGLKNIPAELYEAAELDGAKPWRQFRSVTVPLLTPSIFFVLIITIIGSFQLFDLQYAILGSPATNPVIPRSMSLVYFFYQQGFVSNDKGYAAAIAMIIFVIIGIVTLVQFRLQKRWVSND